MISSADQILPTNQQPVHIPTANNTTILFGLLWSLYHHIPCVILRWVEPMVHYIYIYTGWFPFFFNKAVIRSNLIFWIFYILLDHIFYLLKFLYYLRSISSILMKIINSVFSNEIHVFYCKLFSRYFFYKFWKSSCWII